MKSKYFSTYTMIMTYTCFLIILAIGYVKDTINKLYKIIFWKKTKDKVPILSEFQSFYSRNCFQRSSDCFSFLVTGRPGRIINIIEQETKNQTNKTILACEKLKTFRQFFTKRSDEHSSNISHDTKIETKIYTTTSPLINFGSYNYLGFASDKGNILASLYKSVDKYPINLAAPSLDIGTFDITVELEKLMAKFLYQEDCVVFSMGYGTNTSCIPSLLDEQTLVYSDELNHASIIVGIKMSKCVLRVFKHNNIVDLENRLRFDISQGQPVTHRNWKKIIVLVEGIYSMEGTILKLKELIKLKEKYKFYIFIDEAHSIGALGKTGRGICEYAGVDFSKIDLLMGTFTKSFAGMGGYIAGSMSLINHLRLFSDFSRFGEQMSPVVATQILESLKCIMYTKKGLSKIRRLQRNVQLLRTGLDKLSFFVTGHADSPVVPIVISNPGKLCELSRLCKEEGIGIVIVGYPAAPILFGRVRLCVSSSHKRSDIQKTLSIFDQAGELLILKLTQK